MSDTRTNKQGAGSPGAAPDRPRPATHQWRVVDIVVCAVLGVACGLIFFAWNSVGYIGFSFFDALTPGLGGLAAGVWFLAGPLGALIIRKPGAALFCELLAGFVSMALGNQWGWTTMYSAMAQGLGAELAFAAFAYRRWRLPIALLSGALAGVGAWILEFLLTNHAKDVAFNVIYLVCTTVSGVVLAGLLGWALMRALGRAGALDRFAAGREIRGRA